MSDRMLTTLPTSSSVDEAIDMVDRDGAAIIEDFVDAGTLRGLWDDLGLTLERQAARVIPGSHRWDDEKAPRDDETVPAAMRAGSEL